MIFFYSNWTYFEFVRKLTGVAVVVETSSTDVDVDVDDVAETGASFESLFIEIGVVLGLGFGVVAVVTDGDKGFDNGVVFDGFWGYEYVAFKSVIWCGNEYGDDRERTEW